MEKSFITNREGKKISVTSSFVHPQKGLAFVMHGLGGYKEQPHITLLSDTFLENGYSVISFDTTNSFGESEGDYSDATVTGYYQDLEDVVAWAKGMPWYQEPFCMAGHSLGGLCVGIFAEKFYEKVKGVAPLSTVVSGKLWQKTQSKDLLKKWQKEGVWKREPDTSGRIKILKWNFAQDRMRYDLLKNVKNLTMPLLLVVGENDSTTPVKHQEMLYSKLPGKKELHVIRGAEHTFRKFEHLTQIKEIFSHWIKSLN